MKCRWGGGRRAATEGDAVPMRPTPNALTPRAETPSSGISTALRRATTALLALAAVAAGVAIAGPASAAEDPSRPTATVTRGPSCAPGGIQIQVTAGSAPYDVVLATTRKPDGEDEAQVQPGATVLLQTGPIDWGETVDPRLQYTPLDSTGTPVVDELPDWTMTRPSEKDCAAVDSPAATPTTTAPADPTSAHPRSPAPSPSDPPQPTPSPQPAPAPDRPDQAPTSPTAIVAEGAAGGDGPSSRAVGAGRQITVRATGFQPGEEVAIRLSGDELGQGTVGPDGVAEVPVFVPGELKGPAQLDVVGRSSGVTAGLRLQVAAAQTSDVGGPQPLSVPALLALLSLVGVGGGVVTALGRRGGGFPGSA